MNPRNWFRRNKTTAESIEDSRAISKYLRIGQFSLIGLVLAYVVWASFVARYPIKLPLLPFLPAFVVIFGAFSLGWAIGWIPSRIRRWRMKRDNHRLHERVGELEKSLGIAKTSQNPTVFPDRDPEVSRQQQKDAHNEDADNIVVKEVTEATTEAVLEEVVEEIPPEETAASDAVDSPTDTSDDNDPTVSQESKEAS